MTTHKNKIIFEGGTLTNRAKENNTLTLWVNNGYKRVEIDVGRTPIDQVLQKVDDQKTISVKINSTDSTLFDINENYVSDPNGTKYYLSSFNKTTEFVDPLIEDESNRCELVNGKFIYYPPSRKMLCDLSEWHTQDIPINITTQFSPTETDDKPQTFTVIPPINVKVVDLHSNKSVSEENEK